MSDGHTIAIPPCDEHPALREWPAKNLIQATCPKCGCFVWPEKTARELKARRVIAERGTV